MQEKDGARDVQFAYFALFDQDLVIKLWPPERIAMGMVVCSVLRQELKWAPLVVLNVRRVLSPADWSSMAKHLKRFQGNIHVRASRRQGGSALLKGIILAVDSGWKGPSLLHVTHTDVGDEDCARLAVYLRECPFLHTLWLSDNSITGDGAFALSSALRNCRKLSSLGTNFHQHALRHDWPDIKTDGSDSFRTCADLSYNNIGPVGAARLAAQLVYCSTLTALNLSGCYIGKGEICCAMRLSSTLLFTCLLAYCKPCSQRAHNGWQRLYRQAAHPSSGSSSFRTTIWATTALASSRRHYPPSPTFVCCTYLHLHPTPKPRCMRKDTTQTRRLRLG